MISPDFATLVFFLLVGHSLADYPLQSDFLAQAKNRHTALGQVFWPHALFAHSMIHGGFVALITGQLWLGVTEAVVHGVTDWLKCEGKISLNVDQAIHIGCKVLWAAIVALGIQP
ncbi:hypothetical protein K32_48690 [Kaistia sp. 32K]|uniref:DUF3307 domain-containing protein n=1 Tax=Kaistia sp. 32K TaxID=2795690 RepID=UPI001934F7FC|nr:DUF3307 domain-containing protein [Kaistia sp. 32K]BCP56252.1 hypothetical protein K32_48690 [Kaistia sp. 32K]